MPDSTDAALLSGVCSVSSKQDIRDWFIMASITAFSTSMMTYVFQHPGPAEFAAACTALPAMIGLYHWSNVRDDKEPDAPCPSSRS
jgi:hypothetical protein